VLSYYAALVYRQTGSYEEAARRLKLDRRTVKSKVQEYLKRTEPPA
jgi:DNA-directed RNA polymerase specialized sigma24 family protein